MFIILDAMQIRLVIYICSIWDTPMFIWTITFVLSLLFNYYEYASFKTYAFT